MGSDFLCFLKIVHIFLETNDKRTKRSLAPPECCGEGTSLQEEEQGGGGGRTSIQEEPRDTMHSEVSSRSAESMNRVAMEEVRVGAGRPAEQVSCCHLTNRKKRKKNQVQVDHLTAVSLSSDDDDEGGGDFNDDKLGDQDFSSKGLGDL